MQLNAAASEAELYRFVAQSFHVFEQTVASKFVQSTADRGTLGSAEVTSETAGDPSDPQDLADAMASAWAKIDFESLEEIVDRWARYICFALARQLFVVGRIADSVCVLITRQPTIRPSTCCEYSWEAFSRSTTQAGQRRGYRCPLTLLRTKLKMWAPYSLFHFSLRQGVTLLP